METPLSARANLDPDTMWRAMRVVIERVFGVIERESVLDDCLDILVDVIGADRGLVAIVDDVGALRTINARAKGKTLGPLEREEISRTIIQRALDTGECAMWDVTGRNPSKSVEGLGILWALAAPLHRPGPATPSTRAVLYIDVRDPRKYVERTHVEFFNTAALVIGALLEQRAHGDEARARLGEALSHTTDTRRAVPLDDLIGYPGTRMLGEDVRASLRSEQSMLILGESGTGKTMLAVAIAEASGRRPIVRAMLGGSDDLNTIASELFGHERGAFSGAAGKRIGLVELANGGTMILDELLNLPPHAQKLLLDFTQFGTYRPLGWDKRDPKQANVRIIGATNGDLRAAIKNGAFREDLYHRLAGVVLDVPPLRRRREDIPALAETTLRRSLPARAWTLSLPVRQMLVSPALEWSGNVRQLERVITRARERAIARDPEATEIVVEHFDARDLEGVSPAAASSSVPNAPPSSEPKPLSSTWQELQAERARIDEGEQAVITKALSDANGVVAQAARALGIARTTLASRLDVLGIRARAK